MGNLLGNAAAQADPESDINVTKRMEEKEAVAKGEALQRNKVSQQKALSTARARAAASGASGGSMADYFTSAEKAFERENQWLSSSNVRSTVVGARADYYDSAAKQQGFGFLATENKDWWA